MKTFWAVPVFVLVLYLVGTDGRHVDADEFEAPEEEEQTEVTSRNRDHSSQMRHRRRSRQMFSYDYPPPPFYYEHRRDYTVRQQEEYLSRILKSLDEIISYMQRPPPPPQPVYIPYPVMQYRPCSRPSSRPDTTTKRPDVNESTTPLVPNLTDRWPEMDDENQNWGLSPVELPEYDDQGDGSRPISFDPVLPNKPTSRPPPPVEHGSSQAGMDQSTVRRPGACETAILTCCSIQDKTSQRNCFARYNCHRTYATNRACDPNVIKRVLENFSKAYAPVKKD